MADEKKEIGKVVTFYSYKGGVGRTFAMANIGALLVHWGYKVLCVDWDIEAPGLHFYFPLKQPVERGLYELIEGFKKSQGFRNWREYVYSVNIPRSGRRIDVIYAGADEPSGVVAPLDWEGLYQRDDFGSAIERLRDEWKESYDFIFIDSRTGVTDSSAICTVQLPDVLAFLLTANDQSLKGSVNIVRKAIKARQRLPVERSGLRTIPIVSRFDTREEYELASTWKAKLARELSEFYSSWVLTDDIARSVLERTTIPYIARWSFGEEIVGRQEHDSPSFILFYFTNLAAIIANQFEGVESFINYREAFVTAAQRRTDERFLYDAFISAPREFAEISLQIADLLQRAGFKVFHPSFSVRPRRDVLEQINDGLSRSRNLVFFSGVAMSESQVNEVRSFLRLSIATDFDRRIIPVSMDREGIRNAPGIVRNFRIVPGFENKDQFIAGLIAAEISSSRQN